MSVVCQQCNLFSMTVTADRDRYIITDLRTLVLVQDLSACICSNYLQGHAPCRSSQLLCVLIYTDSVISGRVANQEFCFPKAKLTASITKLIYWPYCHLFIHVCLLYLISCNMSKAKDIHKSSLVSPRTSTHHYLRSLSAWLHWVGCNPLHSPLSLSLHTW